MVDYLYPTYDQDNLVSSSGMNMQTVSLAPFVAPSNITANTIGVWFWNDESSHDFKGVIYSGSPGSLTKIAETACDTIFTSDTSTYQDISFTSPPSLTSGVTYYAGFVNLMTSGSAGVWSQSPSSLSYQDDNPAPTSCASNVDSISVTNPANMPGWAYRISYGAVTSRPTLLPPPPLIARF